MKFLDRLETLAAILKAADGKVVGKKKLQKLIYLCQEKGLYLGYDYTYHHYGVFSADLEAELRLGEAYGLIEQVQSDSDQLSTIISLNQTQSEIEPLPRDWDLLVKAFNSAQPRVLEVLSTIVYLVKAGYSDESLNAELHSLKGHLVSYFDNAWKMYQIHFS